MNKHLDLRHLLPMLASLIGFIGFGGLTAMGAVSPDISLSAYNPENPDEPNPFYELTILTEPSELSLPKKRKIMVGDSVYVTAERYTRQEFVGWILGGETVSTENTYSFEMPEEPVVLTAMYRYNPDAYNPDNPEEPLPIRRLTVYSDPPNVHEPLVYFFEEDSEATVTADDYAGYGFKSWSRDGNVVSTDRSYTFTMPRRPVELTANYVYLPNGPSEPGDERPGPDTTVDGGREDIYGGQLLWHRIKISSDTRLSAITFAVCYDPRISIDYDLAGEEKEQYTVSVSKMTDSECRVEVVAKPGCVIESERIEYPDGTIGRKYPEIRIPVNSLSNLTVGEEMTVTISDATQITEKNESFSAKTTDGVLVCRGNLCPVEDISIDGGDRILPYQKATTYVFCSLPTDSSQWDNLIEWSSSNTEVVSIYDTDGRTCKIRSEGVIGSSVITAKIKGSDTTVSDSIRVWAVMAQIEPDDIAIVAPGQSLTYRVTLLPEEAPQKVIWRLPDERIARIVDTTDNTAVIQGVSPGYTPVAVLTPDYILIEERPLKVSYVTDLRIVGSDEPLQKGDSRRYEAVFDPPSASDMVPIVWYSHDSKIATVDQDGVVTGVGAGETFISVNTDDGSDIHTSCLITVVDNTSIAGFDWRYDGRDLTIGYEDETADLYYSFDGSEFRPTVSALRLNPETTKVYTYAQKGDEEPSDTIEIDIPCFYDGDAICLHTPNTMTKALEWCQGKVQTPVTAIIGRMGDRDLAVLRGQDGLTGIDLSETSFTVTPSLEGMGRLKWVSLPEITEVKGMFDGCESLAAVIWNSKKQMPLSILHGVDNPNLLLYVPTAEAAQTASAKVTNVVVGTAGNYRAERIVISDNNLTPNPFYSPFDFTAGEISYKRRFLQKTGYGGSTCGYEAVMLPFDVQDFTHAVNGPCAPFAADRSNGEKPFWLFLVGDRMEEAAELKAYRPYVIAMPNHQYYYNDCLLAGTITFSSTETLVEATPELAVGHYRGTMERIAKADGIRALNVGEVVDGQAEGSAWINNYRDLRPFEAYIFIEEGPNSIPIFDTAAIDEVMPDGDRWFEVRSEGNVICVVSSFDTECTIYDASGSSVVRLSLTGSETVRTFPLAHGIYLVRVGDDVVKVRL